MPLNIARKAPSRKSTLSTAPSSSSPPVEGINAQEKPASTTTSLPRTRQPLQRAATDTTPPNLARKASDSSIYSTASKVEKKRSAWRGVAKTLPSLLKPSRGASSTSLVSQNAEAAVSNEPVDTVKSSPTLGSKIPVRRPTASPKASLLPELQSTPPPKGRDSNERTSAEFSDGSATMVDDIQPNGRSLFEELAVTRQQLIEATNECSALHEHIHTLESTNNNQLRQSVEEAVNHTKAELLRAHTSELDQKKEINRRLQERNEELALRIRVVEDSKAELTRAHDGEMQSLQLMVKNLQRSLESLQHELKMKDEHTAAMSRENSEFRGRIMHLEEDGRILAEGGAEAQKRLLEDVNHYRHELENIQKILTERNAQFAQLQSSKAETENMLICAQASVDEKDMVIGDLQRRVSGFEESNSSLGNRLIEMERELSETKSSIEHTHQIRIQDYERRLTDADRAAQALRSELTSSSSTIQQLRTALDTARIDAQKSAKAIEEQAAQLRQARKQQTMLEEGTRALEDEKQALEAEKAELARTHTAQVEAERRAVHNLRRSMESSQREWTAKQERSSLLVSRNEELSREVTGLKEQAKGDGEEAQKIRKELEVTKAALSSLEERNQIATETAKEKERLTDEVAQLQRQLEDARNQIGRHNAQVGGEEKLKSDIQKALATIEEQKVVIGRLQHSVGERSREDPQPILPPSLTRAVPTRQTTQRSRSSTVSGPEPSKLGSSSPKPSARTPPTRSRTPSSSPGTTSSTPLLTSSASPRQAHKTPDVQDQVPPTGSTDSESDGDDPASTAVAHHQVDGQSSTDVKRLRPPTESGLVYRMGHAVFGSLWQRIWG